MRHAEAHPPLPAGWPRIQPTNTNQLQTNAHHGDAPCCVLTPNPLRKPIVSLLLPTTNACRPLVSDASLSPARSPFILLLFRQPGVTQSATCHGMVWWWCGSIDQVVERLSGRQPTPLMNRLLHCECCIASCFKSAEASHYLCGDTATATSSLLLPRPDRPPSFAFRLPHDRRTSPPAPLPPALEGRGEGEYWGASAIVAPTGLPMADESRRAEEKPCFRPSAACTKNGGSAASSSHALEEGSGAEPVHLMQAAPHTVRHSQAVAQPRPCSHHPAPPERTSS